MNCSLFNLCQKITLVFFIIITVLFKIAPAHAMINNDKVVWIKKYALINYGGAAGQYSIKLSSAPSGNVDFFANVDTSSYSESPAINTTNLFHTFTSANWNIPWNFTVSAANNPGPSILTSYTFNIDINATYTSGPLNGSAYLDTSIAQGKVYLSAQDASTIPIVPLGGILNEASTSVQITDTFSYDSSSCTNVSPTNVQYNSLTSPAQVTFSSDAPGSGYPLQVPNFGNNTFNTTMSVIDDGIVEGTRVVDGTYNYNACKGGSPVANIGNSFLIYDNDTGIVSATTTDATSTENATPVDNASFRISLDKANYTGEDLIVNYTMSGSATNGTDYTSLSGSATISSNASIAYVDIPLIPTTDALAEGTENAVLTITSLSGPAASLFSIDTAHSSSSVAIIDGATDTVPPTVTINQAAGQSDPTSSSTILFTAVFNEPIQTVGAGAFACADVSVTNGSCSSVTLVSGQTYTVSVLATASGTVTATIPAGGINDVAGNANTVSTSTDNSVTYNPPAPTYPITYNANSGTGGTVPASQTKTQSINLTLQNNTGVLVRTGFTFAGWNTLANGSGTHYAVGGTFTTDATTTLFAEWTAVTDSDGDGVSDAIENLAPNGGDGNGDGILDRNQATVVSASNTVTGSTVTMALTAGCTLINGFTVSAESALGTDASYDFPLGLNNFQIQCSTQGEVATVKVYYTQVYNTSGWGFRKYMNGSFADLSTFVNYTTEDIDPTAGVNNVTVANFTIADDGLFDSDPTDAYIVDPSGPASPVTVVVSSGGGGGGGGGGSSPGGGGYIGGGKIIVNQATTSQNKINLVAGGEPNVPAEFSNYVCTRYLRDYILPDKVNNKDEVIKLQKFLNDNYEEHLSLDGNYDQEDIDAVNRFQMKYKSQILSPWGFDKPTGRVYITTTAKINLMSCENKLDNKNRYFTEYLKEGDVSLEVVKLQDFLNIIFSPTSGYPTNGLQLSTKFDKKTTQALKIFQSVYKDTVLKPWGLKNPSGWFYQTSRKSANLLMGYDEGFVVIDNGKKIR